jgi:hypothetical protein
MNQRQLRAKDEVADLVEVIAEESLGCFEQTWGR